MPDSATLEIHELNVGQGDSILILNRDLAAVRKKIVAKKGEPAAAALAPIDYMPYAIANDVALAGTVRKALLVDGGDDEYGGDVLGYLEMHGVLAPGTVYTPNLSLLVSHYHDDHMAGLRSIFKERVDPTRKGEKVTYRERYRPGDVYMTLGNKKADPSTQRFGLFGKDVTSATGTFTNPTRRHNLGPGGVDAQGATTRIELGTGVDGIAIGLYAIAAAQSVFSRTTGGPVAVVSKGKKADQNDRSIVLVLEYGSFRYFVGGDIGGNGKNGGGNFGTNGMDTAGKKFFSGHADVESKLGPALEAFFPGTTAWKAGQPKYPNAGYCTAVKANHHGSSSSVDVYSLATMRPCVAVISSGVKARFHRHPTQQVMDRMSNTPRWPLRGKTRTTTTPNTIVQVYLTEVAAQVKGKVFPVDLRGGRIVGDIILRPVDESVAAVQASTAAGTPLRVQVYGTGAQTGLADPTSVLRPTVARNAARANYPIGPWIHQDTH